MSQITLSGISFYCMGSLSTPEAREQYKTLKQQLKEYCKASAAHWDVWNRNRVVCRVFPDVIVEKDAKSVSVRLEEDEAQSKYLVCVKANSLSDFVDVNQPLSDCCQTLGQLLQKRIGSFVPGFKWPSRIKNGFKGSAKVVSMSFKTHIPNVPHAAETLTCLEQVYSSHYAKYSQQTVQELFSVNLRFYQARLCFDHRYGKSLQRRLVLTAEDGGLTVFLRATSMLLGRKVEQVLRQQRQGQSPAILDVEEAMDACGGDSWARDYLLKEAMEITGIPEVQAAREVEIPSRESMGRYAGVFDKWQTGKPIYANRLTQKTKDFFSKAKLPVLSPFIRTMVLWQVVKPVQDLRGWKVKLFDLLGD